MTTITIKEEGSAKNRILIFNNLDKLRETITGYSVRDNGKRVLTIKEGKGKKMTSREVELVSYSVDQYDDCKPYLVRLGIITRDEYMYEVK